MAYVISIGIGMMIVFLALHLIKKEVMKASFFKNVQRNSSQESIPEDVIVQVQRLEKLVDEMNQSFYDIVSDLEGHYSVHEKEIEILNTKMNAFSDTIEDLSRSMYHQSKELQTFSIKKNTEQESHLNHPAVSNHKEVSAYDEVIRLKALGYDEQQIAKRMNKGIREIKMLLNLKK